MVHQINASPSTILRSAIVLDDGKDLNYTDYPVYEKLLDLPYVKDITYYCSRQVGKSIFIATMIAKHSLIPFNRSTYIAPQDKSVKEFSRLKLGMILEHSPVLNQLLMQKNSPLNAKGSGVSSNNIINDVYLKIFANAASIKLGYANDAKGVDRIRGGSTDILTVDEAQNIDLSAVMPVIKPMLTSSDRPTLVSSGTPLNEHDPLSVRFDMSTQHTMVVKCTACNRWTTLDSIKVIGKHGAICPRCGKALDVSKGQFVPMNRSSDSAGFHINRLMILSNYKNPLKWKQLIDDINDPSTSEDKVMQEIFGRPSGGASQLIGPEDIRKIAVLPPENVNKSFLEVARANYKHKLIHSLDWGGGAYSLGAIDSPASSRTSETLWKVSVENFHIKMELLYYKLYPLIHPSEAVDEVLLNMQSLPEGAMTMCDALGGATAIDRIRRSFATNYVNRIFLPIQLGQSITGNVREHEDRIVISRNILLTKFFNKVKASEVLIPNHEQTIQDITKNYMAEVEFENSDGKRIWRKRTGTNDDILFSSFFAYVGAAYFLNPPEIKF